MAASEADHRQVDVQIKEADGAANSNNNVELRKEKKSDGGDAAAKSQQRQSKRASRPMSSVSANKVHVNYAMDNSHMTALRSQSINAQESLDAQELGMDGQVGTLGLRQ